MKALVFAGPRRMEVAETPLPVPTRDRVVLKVAAAGVCGSDIDGFGRENGRRTFGQIMGHEAVGVITDTTVEHKHLLGLSMTFTPIIRCGKCADCANGADNRCVTRRLIGVHPEVPGAFAEYVQVPVANLFPAAATSLSTLAEPLAVAWNAIAALKSSYEGSVLVLGAGTIGTLCAFTLRTRDKQVVNIYDPLHWKAEWLTKLGIVNLHELPSISSDGAESRNGHSYGLIIDCVGSAQSMKAAVGLAAPGANIHLVGMATPTIEINVQQAVSKEITIVTSYAYRHDLFSLVAASLPELTNALGGIDPIECSLEEAPELFNSLLDPGNRIKKLVITP
jgi:threonine dehydrogenase-like Zn-dependent dehydrogenase